MDAIFESLQREFCPPLDSSLLAALLADIDPDADARQIDALRSTLIELAAHADAEAPPDLAFEYEHSDGTSSAPDFCTSATRTGTGTTTTSSLVHAVNPAALAFLQAALPHLPAGALVRALADAAAEPDMWELICALLSDDTARELRERDLDAGANIDADLALPAASTGKQKKKRKPRRAGTTLALSDVRQQQHHPARPRGAARTDAGGGGDAWTQLASLATHLAELLPPHPPALFLSFFHAPGATPYTALCAALASLASGSAPPPASASNAAEEAEEGAPDPLLFPLLDVLLPAYPALPPHTLLADAELALAAARAAARRAGTRDAASRADQASGGEAAFELVRLLRALDDDAREGRWAMGVYHAPLPSSPSSASAFNAPSLTSTSTAKLPTGPAPTPPPPPLALPLPATSSSSSAGRDAGWTRVPARRTHSAPTVHPLAAHIPAYRVDVNGVRVRDAGGRALYSAYPGSYAYSGSTGEYSGAGDADAYRRRARESLRRRDELLREAARAWQGRGGGGKGGRGGGRGGEVALYFAGRARELQEVARREALGAARAMVWGRRANARERDTLDLHGVTAAEAVVLVNEVLDEGGWGGDKPLKIITGRGAHSAGQVSVLKPALRRALEGDGWVVGSWEGGVSVRGRRSG
ncbi:hypothetical protein DFH09DRAFT_1363043 [Mycena vulgaris]|nr:hypothetical protein DFH09DRAFT_1363043 [Mycena vulgaris]